MRVLVTGGAGFIGSHIVDRLVDGGHEVVVVDDLSSGQRANVNPRARMVDLDLSAPDFLDVAASFRPDVISHCAAQASVPGSVSDPQRDALVNIVGGINVCKAAVEAGSSQLVYITTGGALYGEPEYLPCDEDHPIRPISPYGLSKWTLEQYLPILLPPSMGVKVLRGANVYGPRQDPHGESGVVAIFGSKMVRGEPVVIFGDGERTRDYVYVGDVVKANLLAMDGRGDNDVYNIASGGEVQDIQIFEEVRRASGSTVEPSYGDPRPGDPNRVSLDCSKAADRLRWRASVSLADGVQRSVDWLRRTMEP